MANIQVFKDDLISSEERKNFLTLQDISFKVKDIVSQFLDLKITELHAKFKQKDLKISDGKWKHFISSNTRTDNKKSKVNYDNVDYQCINTEPIELAKAYVTFSLNAKQGIPVKAASADNTSESLKQSIAEDISAPSNSCHSDPLANGANASITSSCISSSAVTDTSLTFVIANDVTKVKPIKIFADFDLAAVLHILLNCNAFCDINLDVIDNLKDIRNNIFGHPSKPTLSAEDKESAIGHLKEFVELFLNVWKEGENDLRALLAKLHEEGDNLVHQDEV